jgi:DNA-binding NtrC family response regulator
MPNASAPILLIDDDELIAGSLRDYLRRLGLCVDVAVEPAAAEALMRKQPYAIVVVDPYLTGGIHGQQGSLLATIRLLQPHVPIMIVTGYGSAAMIHAASADEGTSLLFKPQPVAHLGQMIAEASTPPPSFSANAPHGKARP